MRRPLHIEVSDVARAQIRAAQDLDAVLSEVDDDYWTSQFASWQPAFYGLTSIAFLAVGRGDNASLTIDNRH